MKVCYTLFFLIELDQHLRSSIIVDKRFLAAKPNSQGESYESFMNVSQPISEPGEYLLSFYIIIYCNGNGCQNVTDYIGLYVSTATDVRRADVAYMNYSTLLKENKANKWIQQELVTDVNDWNQRELNVND
jgi:hypothetical protein